MLGLCGGYYEGQSSCHWAKMPYKEQSHTADGKSEDDISKGDIIISLKIVPNYKQ